jgi:pimeloyl-ACP methyl ester carboxylesterase
MLRLFEERAGFYPGTATPEGLSRQMAKAFCDGFGCGDSVKLLNYRLKSYGRRPGLKGKWPLVVYLASYGSTGFENVALFEGLAMQGYVVLSLSSIGRFPGDMTTEPEDLFEQVKDAEFGIHYLHSDPDIDLGKLAIVGYSWGGLAGNLLAAQVPNVRCIVSMEGSEFHHYGQKEPDSKKEDSNFNRLVHTREFIDRSMSVPYLRFESGPSTSSHSDSFDSVFNFAGGIPDKRILQLNEGKHEDFCCIGPYTWAAGNCPDNGKYVAVLKLTLAFLDEKMRSGVGFDNLAQGYIPATMKDVTK